MAIKDWFTTKAAPALGDSGTITTSAQLKDELFGNLSSTNYSLSPYSARNNIGLAYRDNVIGHFCADLIANNTARIDLIIKKGDLEIEDRFNPLYKRIQRPNPKTSKARFIQQIVFDLVLTGNAYVLRNELSFKLGSTRSGKGEWWVLPSRNVTLNTNSKGQYPDGYKFIQADGTSVEYPCDPVTGKSEVLHLTNFNPLDDYIGLPTAVAAGRSLQIFTASEEYNFNTLKKGGMPKFIAWFKDFANGQTRTMSKEQKMQVGSALKEFAGPNRTSDIMVTQGDLEIKELSSTAKDMEFSQGQQEAARNIARGFGVPSILLGIPGDNTYSNQEQALVSLYTNKIIPLLDYILDELTNWMAPVWGDDVCIEFDLDSVDQLAAHNREKWASVKDVNWLTDDEKRAMFGFKPLKETETETGTVNEDGSANLSEVLPVSNTDTAELPEVLPLNG